MHPIIIENKLRSIQSGLKCRVAEAAKIGIGALLAVVEVAHVISGYDNAQRLKSVEGIGGALLHAHRSELKSELEAIYRHSKGLMSGGLNQLSEHDQRMLHDQCQTLMKLRAQWRADFKHRLAGIKSAEAGWLDTLLRRKEEGLQKDREAKARAVLDAIEIVQLMHFSLMLQMALAGAAGRMEEFREAILPDECHDWRELKEFSLKRACEICGYTYCQPVEFLPFLDAVSDLTRFWSPDRWSKEQSRVVRERETPKTKKEDTPE